MPINQPSNQIKLTNLALVRMKKGCLLPRFFYVHQTVTDRL